MKFKLTKTSCDKYSKEITFKNLKEFVKFVFETEYPVIISCNSSNMNDPAGIRWKLEIYDDYRED
jgi:hypothetical protein